jgi:hypothetical protein
VDCMGNDGCSLTCFIADLRPQDVTESPIGMVSGQSLGQRTLERGRLACWTRGWEMIEMEGYRTSKHRLTSKLEPSDPEWTWAVEQLRPDFDQGDELWHYDEPAPSGVNAGAMGIAMPSCGRASRSARSSPPSTDPGSAGGRPDVLWSYVPSQAGRRC